MREAGAGTARRCRRAAVLLAAAVLAACSAGEDPDAVIPPTTAAPPVDSGFVPPPDCVPGSASLPVWTAGVRIDARAGTADAVLRIENTGSEPCEIELGASPLVTDLVEPNVVVEAGGWAQLVVGPSGRECLSPEVLTDATVVLEGVELTVPTVAIGICGFLFTELFAVDHPTEPCTADDLSAIATAGGIAVRNDGVRGCIVGLVEAASADGTDVMTAPSPTGGDVTAVTALAPFDVVLVPTAIDAACARGGPGGTTVQFSSGASVEVVLPACTTVAAGAPHPLYGSSGRPLQAADPADWPDGWFAELDPFGDPCETVPLAPYDLADGSPVLSPPVIEVGDTGRTATWGSETPGRVTQYLDGTTVPDVLMRGDVDVGGVPGPVSASVGTVGAPPEGEIVIVLTESERDCVRWYVVGPGLTIDEGLAIAARWAA